MQNLHKLLRERKLDIPTKNATKFFCCNFLFVLFVAYLYELKCSILK